MAPIIGFTGFARAGKSTAAKHLVENHGFTELSFAKTLKDMAYAVDPIVVVEQEGVSEQPFRLRQVVDQLGWEAAKDEFPEVRAFLQRLGTEGVRGHLGDRAWVDVVSSELYRLWVRDHSRCEFHHISVPCPKRRPIVIADVRFDNEAEFIRQNGGRVVRIDRTFHKRAGAAHASETPVQADETLMNIDGDSAAMRADLDALVEALK